MDPWGTPRMTGRGYLTMIICRDHVHYFSLRYFTCPADNRSIPTQKQFTLSAACSCYIIQTRSLHKKYIDRIIVALTELFT